MRIVGTAAGITLHAPEDAYFSYFNSPYIGHDLGSAIDIYPSHQEWGGAVIAPTSGKVVKIKKMQMGRPKQFPTHALDFAIGIQPSESDSSIVRVMHSEPTVSVGNRVDVGDQIGKAIRSRYFNYWTGPHYHVEVMSLDSFERSSRSYPLDLEYQYTAIKTESPREEIEFLVQSVTVDNIIGYPQDLEHASIGDLTGVAAIDMQRSKVGILEGGLSHYRIGGVVGTEQLQVGEHVGFRNAVTGTVRETRKSVSLFERGPHINSYLDGREIRGLSCFIYPKNFTKKKIPQLILIPMNYGELRGVINEGDLCQLKIQQCNNTVIAE
jgi:hypothetical protein